MSALTLLSWNVNGIRAAEKKGFTDFLKDSPADIICVQETKACPDQLSLFLRYPEGRTAYYASAEKAGYSGTATFSRTPALSVTTDFSDSVLHGEGRITLTEHPHFFLFNVYFPNGGKSPEHFQYKFSFYRTLFAHADLLRKKKPVIICGDMNIAPTALDLARPKENEKHVGFTPEERALLTEVTSRGYLDTFRHLHPTKVQYTWWDVKTRSRERNVGWRLDACYVSTELLPHVTAATVEDTVEGSDHCPVTLTLTFPPSHTT